MAYVAREDLHASLDRRTASEHDLRFCGRGCKTLKGKGIRAGHKAEERSLGSLTTAKVLSSHAL